MSAFPVDRAPDRGPRPDPEGGAANASASAALARAWESARRRWAEPILLSTPVDSAQVPLARIDLEQRSVEVNLGRLHSLGVEASLEAILAHEVGHHLRYPRDLATAARLHVLERALIPLDGFSALNLFTDLLINQQLGRELRRELTAVYVAALRRESAPVADVYRFYLAIYEELWTLAPGTLVGPDGDGFAAAHPSYRAQAHVLAQDLFQLGPDLTTQFVYFLAMLMPYVTADADRAFAALGCRCEGEPSPDDWARALTLDARERRALERARREGWLGAEQIDRLLDRDAFARRIAGVAGRGEGAAQRVPEIMAAWYRREAQRHLIEPPARRRRGEAVVPTTLEPWEPGDPLVEIDWAATLTRKGPALGAAAPLRRDRLADEEGLELPLWQPRTELYLDVSGSMPDPRTTRNAMTLAAQILAAATIQAGGSIRALVYSSSPVLYWSWCRSAAEISRFLMHYVGAGTSFPFDILDESSEACRADPPTRVILSDLDFTHNVEQRGDSRELLRRAAEASAPLILLLHQSADQNSREYERLGARVVHVEQLDDFPRVAAALSRALFERKNAS